MIRKDKVVRIGVMLNAKYTLRFRMHARKGKTKDTLIRWMLDQYFRSTCLSEKYISDSHVAHNDQRRYLGVNLG